MIIICFSQQGDIRVKIASLADRYGGWFTASNKGNGLDPAIPAVKFPLICQTNVMAKETFFLGNVTLLN